MAVSPGSSKKTSRAASKKAGQSHSLQGLVAEPAGYYYSAIDDKSLLQIIEKVRNGLSFQEFQNLRKLIDFSLEDWAQYLQLSVRTLQRNEKEKKGFASLQSERIVELVMLRNYGVEIFGSKEKFNSWLNSRSIALGGVAPKDLFDTSFGIQMVRDALTRIAHGVFA